MHQPSSVPFPKSKYEVAACLPKAASAPNSMPRTLPSQPAVAPFANVISAQRLQLVSAGKPASRQSTKAADIPRPALPPTARLSGGVGAPAVKVRRSAASPLAVGVCAARDFMSVPSPAALAVENVSQSVEAAGLPAAAPGKVFSTPRLSRPRSLLSRLSKSAVPRPVLPNRFIERTNAGVPSFAAHVGR